MRKLPGPLRQIFRPMTPRSSVIERGLVLTSILAAVVLAAMALVVHRINEEAGDASKRSIRSVEATATLDRLQLALRDVDMAGRDVVAGHARDRADVDRYEAARFQARVHLTALGPLAGDEPAQAERLSRLGPLINRQFALGLRTYGTAAPSARDEVDGLIGSMRDDERGRLDGYQTTQRAVHERSTWIMVGALALVSGLSLLFWALLKIEFAARRTLEGRLIEAATTDELTGVANRRDFDRRMVQEWTFRSRYRTALSLLIVDVDDLLRHNAQWGHVAADAILREVARRIAVRLRHGEVLARSGGDEFAVIVPHYRNEALAIAEQLREQIGEALFHLQVGDRALAIRVTVSVGVADASDVETPRELLAAAEAAVFGAKDRGRNAVSAYLPGPTTNGSRVAAVPDDRRVEAAAND